MANKNRFLIAQSDIVALLNTLEQAVFQRRDLEKIFAEHRSFWRLAKSLLARDFIALLVRHTAMKQIDLVFPTETKTLYIWKSVTAFELATHIRTQAYLSHYSALYLHGLTDQIPKQIYVNVEQSSKPDSSVPLTQEAIDDAFTRPQRQSQAHARYRDYTLVLLNGKFTGRLGVVEVQHMQAGRIALTSLERTLIDLAVRPDYVGGVFEVVEAYRRAASTVSINKLVSLLYKLGYRYPYHQAIGFYLERAGTYRPAQVQLLRKQPQELDFYLTHDMGATDYSPEWRLHFPKGF